MELYIDSADIRKIKCLMKWLPIDGITVNPSIISEIKLPLKKVIKELLSLTEGFLHVQVISTQVDSIIREAEELHNLSNRIIVKIPVNENGLEAIKKIDTEEIMITATALFSVTQAIVAAKAGAKYIAPYVSRVNKIEQSGVNLVKEIKKTISDLYGYPVKIIAASVKNSYEVSELIKIGVDAITLNPEVLKESCKHFLTEEAVSKFNEDWNKTFKQLSIFSELKS